MEDEKSLLIRTLSKASDKYGHPYLVGYMESNHVNGLMNADEESLKQYAIEQGLIDNKGGGYVVKDGKRESTRSR